MRILGLVALAAVTTFVFIGVACTLDTTGQRAAGQGAGSTTATGAGGDISVASVGGSTASATTTSNGSGGDGAAMGGAGGAGGAMVTTCGDGTLEPPTEQCDDNNLNDGDGCSAMCLYDGSTVCPPATTTIDLGSEPIVISGTTSTATDDSSLDCGAGGGSGAGPDVVVAVTPNATGRLTAVLEGTFTKVVYIRPGCTDAHVDCEINDMDSTAGADVTMGTTYYVFVDGETVDDHGLFKLSLTLEACGDGVVNKSQNEECDDGNLLDDDHCSSTCVVECAGGTKNTATDHCYRVVQTLASWDDALAGCLALGNGYDLAAITNTGERDFVDGFISNDMWIGGNDIATEGTFVWSNGEPWWATPPWGGSDPDNGNGGPEQHCVMLDAVGGSNTNDEFRDEPCADEKRYLCELTPAGT